MNANRVSINDRNAIKCKIAEILNWDIRDFELSPAGCKNGRPYWHAERYDAPLGEGFAFSAFDAADIYELHSVQKI